MQRTPRTAFAVPFVVTVACGGAGSSPRPPSGPEWWHVRRLTDTACEASYSGWNSGCPAGAACNPPPPMLVACPPQLAAEPGASLRILQRAGGQCEVPDEAACASAPCPAATSTPVPCPVELPPAAAAPDAAPAGPPDPGADPDPQE